MASMPYSCSLSVAPPHKPAPARGCIEEPVSRPPLVSAECACSSVWRWAFERACLRSLPGKEKHQDYSVRRLPGLGLSDRGNSRGFHRFVSGLAENRNSICSDGRHATSLKQTADRIVCSPIIDSKQVLTVRSPCAKSVCVKLGWREDPKGRRGRYSYAVWQAFAAV
jgi:hypothetical protein